MNAARSSTRFILLAALAAGHPAAAATDIHVAPCGDDAWTGQSPVCAAPNGPKRTIQAAINVAAHGDVVLLADGAYTGPGNRDMSYGGRAITVRSASGNPHDCIIDCEGDLADPHRAFVFSNQEGADSILYGITVTGGLMPRGGAILCENGSSPLIHNCIFQGNKAWPEFDLEGGGAIYFDASDPNLLRCEFIANHAEMTVGQVGGGALRITPSAGHVTECSFESNTVSGGLLLGVGGAIFLGGPPFPSSTTTVIRGCIFIDNSAVNQGGAVRSARGSATLIDCHFERNQVLSPQLAFGGAFAAISAPGLPAHSTLINCTFHDNSSGVYAGALGVVETEATILSCQFIQNEAFGDGQGGAAFVSRGVAQASFTNCLFVGNIGSRGGGAIAVGTEGTPTAEITNCTFVENRGVILGGGAVRTHAGTTNISNSILWDDAPNEILVSGGSVNVVFSTVKGGWPGNVSLDPQFASVAGSNFTLSPWSPCIDAGDSARVPSGVTADLAFHPRFIGVGLAPGCGPVDMGAYEFQSGACYANCDCSTTAPALNVADFACFLQKFAAADPYANCDASTTPPILNVADFGCFLHSFAVGCP